MKKFVVLFTMFLVLYFAHICSIKALNNGSAQLLVVGTSTAERGETISMDLKLNIIDYGDSSSLMYGQYNLYFDNNKIEYINYEIINGYDPMLGVAGVAQQTPNMFHVSVGINPGISENELIIRVNFKVKDNVPDGTIVNFNTHAARTRMVTEMYNIELGGNFLEIPTSSASHSLTVSGGIPLLNNPPSNDRQNKTTTTSSKSRNADLKSLVITDYILDIPFDKSKLNYNLEIPFNVSKLEIKATADDSKSKIVIEGNEELKVGNNVIKIIVTAEDGTKKEYKLNITKLEEEIEAVVTSIEEKHEDNKKNDTDEGSNLLVRGSIAVGGILVFGAIGTFIFKKIKLKKALK